MDQVDTGRVIDIAVAALAVGVLFGVYTQAAFFLARDASTPVILATAVVLVAITVFGGRRLFW